MATLLSDHPSGCWVVRYRLRARTSYFNTGIPRFGRAKPPLEVEEMVIELATKELQERRGIPPPPPPVSLQALETCYLESIRSLRVSSQWRLGGVVRRWREWATSKGIKDAHGLKAAHGALYLEHIREKSPATQSFELGVLGSLWLAAQRAGLVSNDTASPFKARVRVPKRIQEPYSQPQIDAILAIDEPAWIVPAIRIALYTGARSHSIAGLRWEDISWDRNTMHFRVSKTDPYTVPLHPDLKDVLLPIWESRGRPEVGLIFVEVLGRSSNYLSRLFTKAARCKGISSPKFHRLRHTFITRCAESGIPLRTAMFLANHKSSDIHAAYVHVRAENMIGAVLPIRFAPSGQQTEPSCEPFPSRVLGCS